MGWVHLGPNRRGSLTNSRSKPEQGKEPMKRRFRTESVQAIKSRKLASKYQITELLLPLFLRI